MSARFGKSLVLLAVTALVSSGCAMYTFGANGSGQLGLGDTAPRSAPRFVQSQERWDITSVGVSHTCALLEDATGLWCWGDNTFGQLGLGNTTSRLQPTPVPKPAGVSSWVAVAAGEFHTCAIDQGSNLWCWGANNQGQLGVDDLIQRTSPTAVTLAGGAWARVTTGSASTCALKSNGNIWCWGDNSSGQLGLGGVAPRARPFKVGAAGFKMSEIDSSRVHTCGVELGGTLWCWGANFNGQLGSGGTADSTVPVAVGSASNWVATTTGSGTSCARNAASELWCWGLGSNTGTGLSGNIAPTQVVPGSAWDDVDSGWDHTCAVRSDATLWCFGENGSGQLGIGNTTNAATPTQIVSVLEWRTVSAGGDSTLGVIVELEL